jgi:hypothetical protein
MTNYHVIEPFRQGRGERVVLRFDYETDSKGLSVSPGRECRLAADWRLIDSPVPGLDFALIRLKEQTGNDRVASGTRGVLRPARHTFRAGNPLIILQHPDAGPLKMSIGSVVDPDCGSGRVSYTANTEAGSSGSPCFTSGLELVALHHWGANPNRGVRLGPVLDFLQTRLPQLREKGLQDLIG